jgi:hypothetical protein
MAVIFTSDSDAQLFTGVDPYRFDVDNRPLRRLIQNDINMNAELTADTAEIVTARTDNSTGTPVTYSSLDARLEALSIAGLANASVSYSIFQAQAERNRAQFQSGWLFKPSTRDYNDNYGTTAFSGDDYGALIGSQYAAFNQPDTIFLLTEYDGLFNPLPLLVNGWLVRMSWYNAGGNAGSASTSYPNGTIKLPAAPSSGGRQDFVFLETWLKRIPVIDGSGNPITPIFWLYGSPQYKAAIYGEGVPVLCTTSDPTNGSFETGNYTINPLDPRVVHTLSRLNDGSWLQVQSRIRIVPNIDPTVDDPFSGANAALVTAQGSQGAPVSGRSFTNMLATSADAGLWRSGAGSADTAAIGTYDGYSYAVPMLSVHRRSQQPFTMGDQNGAKTSPTFGTDFPGLPTGGNMASSTSGRPDGLYYDQIIRRDFKDLRMQTGNNGVDFSALRDLALEDILTGKSRSQWTQLSYPTGLQTVWGNRLFAADTIFDNTVYPIGASPEMTNSNWVIDKSVDPALAYSRPDGVRRSFATSKTTQRLEFWIDVASNTNQYTGAPAGFITVTGGGNARSVNINPQVLSGTIGNLIGLRQPVWHFASDYQGITVAMTAGAGLSYNFAVDVTGRTSEKILANVDIIFPTKSGVTSLPIGIGRQDYFNGTTTFTSRSIPANLPIDVKADPSNTNTGLDSMWVTDTYNNQVNLYTGMPTANPLSANSINAATTLGGVTNSPSNPFGVAVWGNPFAGAGSGAVWVSEYYTQKIKKYVWNTGTSQWNLANTITGATGVGFTYSGGGLQHFGGTYIQIAVSADGASLFVSDMSRHVIWKFVTATLVGSVMAGVLDTPGLNSGAGDIHLNAPFNINVDPDISGGVKLWVADYQNGRVLRMSTTGTITVDVQVKDSDSTGGSLDAQITNSDQIIAVGTPGTAGFFYLMVGGVSSTTVPPGDTFQRVFKLDENFNIVAQSAQMNRIGAIACDSTSAPSFVYVARGGSAVGPYPEIRVLNFSNLSVAADYGPVYFAGPSISNIHGMTYVPAFGSYTTPTLWLLGQKDGHRQVVRMNVTGGSVLSFGAVEASPTGTANFGTFSNTYLNGGTMTFYETVLDFTGTGGGTIFEWTNSGTTFTRGGSAILTLTQIPYGSAVDGAGHLYVTFPLVNAELSPSYTGGSVVRRYTKSGTWGLTGTFGTGVNTSATNGVAAPTAINYIVASTKIVVDCKKTKTYSNNNDGTGFDQSRLVFLNSDDTSWGTNPFNKDTNNSASITLGLTAPCAVTAKGDDLFISDLAQAVIYRLKKAVTGDIKTYQLVGQFGVRGEQGSDHGHISGAVGIALSGVGGVSTHLMVADTAGSRILTIHLKMASVSLASGNIETFSALTSTERLRIWSDTTPYMGVGKNLVSVNEYIFSEQALSISPSLHITTLGRAPLTLGAQNTNSSFRGCITRLPFAGAPTYDDTSFVSDLIQLGSLTNPLFQSAMLKLPIITHGMQGSANFSDHSSDGFLIAFPRNESYYATRMLRGMASSDGNSGAVFAACAEMTPKADGTYPNHFVLRTYLIKRHGKAYLMIVTRVNANNQYSVIGDAYAGEALHAVDLFEVPGRLLVR